MKADRIDKAFDELSLTYISGASMRGKFRKIIEANCPSPASSVEEGKVCEDCGKHYRTCACAVASQCEPDDQSVVKIELEDMSEVDTPITRNIKKIVLRINQHTCTS